MNTPNTMTPAQVTALQALNCVSNGKLLATVTTDRIASRAGMTPLAAHNALKALADRRLVEETLVANASPQGGAYKSAWGMTLRGRNTLREAK